MPKFVTVDQTVNEKLIAIVESRVEDYLSQIFEAQELTKEDNIYAFRFGTVQVFIQIKPYHFDNALVYMYSYLAENVPITLENAGELLRLNAIIPFGSFGITFDNTVIYAYSMPGVQLDFEEFRTALQTVATIADNYDEKVLAMVS
ncbi:MAG: hypothetical protein H7Y04_10675 [Verrucomicrobia bacterium]|nr:hypothetical protein [Cytophagales bacterium]